ncbi:MAG: acylneuraminate cytidylyltransferase [Ignavibacteria bacterium]|nr:acylneuraminate cytidylyltransferase [Ignavibacteria bacterium]
MGKEAKSKIVIVQARYGSTRLRGKILKNISGKPILWHVINRLSYSKMIDKIVVATTTGPEDDKTEQFCIDNDISYYRGDVNNVLSRYYETAKKFRADIIIRITSDCPLIDPVILDKMIEQFLSFTEPIDYFSNVIQRTFPRGLDIEIFSFEALEKAFTEAKTDFDREHVTPYFYNNPGIFKIKNYQNDIDYSFHRWTVDTEEDFRLIEEIYRSLYQPDKLFLFEETLNLFETNPDLIKINQHIKQKLN